MMDAKLLASGSDDGKGKLMSGFTRSNNSKTYPHFKYSQSVVNREGAFCGVY